MDRNRLELAMHRKHLKTLKRAQITLKGVYEMQGVLNAMLQHSLANVPLREKLDGHLSAMFALPWPGIQLKGAISQMNPRATRWSWRSSAGCPRLCWRPAPGAAGALPVR